MPVALDQGREAFRRQAWADAYAELSAADRERPLDLADLERLTVAAHLVGRYEESAEGWTRAHHECLRLGDSAGAARCAFWLGFGLLVRGEPARGTAWLARGQRLIDDGRECPARGYLLVPAALGLMREGNAEDAYGHFAEAGEIGGRFADPDLTVFGQLGRGQALVRLGRIAEGMALIDEVMVAVTAREVSPIAAGTVYCAALEVCQQVFDLRRAREWTAALSNWCASQPDLVPYRGHCLAHRAEIMQLQGAWPDAMEEAQRACEVLSGHAAVALAHYQQGELHRLRGEFAEAEEAYRRTSRWGWNPHPGLALLRLAQGRVDAADRAIRHAMDEAQDRAERSRMLAAYVEIVLVTRDVPAARSAATELSGIAATLDAPFLRAVSARASGAVLLAEGDPRAALGTLRPAWTAFRDMDAPYEAARVRVLVGLACRVLGDEDTADMEFDAAGWVFEQLGAAPDLARVRELSRASASGIQGGLTRREVEVLRLVAAGKTNRAIADALVISERTVARHMSNIFTKLGVSTRSAATAYAYEHGVV
jgi:DNA-binding CsgD family transcriptional regulator/tetratricopeptide (TPR) repeat protein